MPPWIVFPEGIPARMNDRPYITCRELIEFLYLYLSGELPPDRVVEFERHLSVCPSCVAYIATYKEAISLARQALDRPDQPAEAVPDELVTAILETRKQG